MSLCYNRSCPFYPTRGECESAVLCGRFIPFQVKTTMTNSTMPVNPAINTSVSKLREYIKDPQHGAENYGTWGALNPAQREFLRRFADEMDMMEQEIRRLRGARNE